MSSTQDESVEIAVGIYERNQRSFKTMAQHVHDTIRDRCDPSSIHTIEYRPKNIDKFRKKCLKMEDGKSKYIDPLNQITDLAGVRVIVFVRDTVAQVCNLISEMYDVKEQEDVGERVYKQGRFGYQSVHMLVHLDKKIYLGTETNIENAVCEIQVRTILQHAWAELEHDIQYQGDQIPLELAKRFSALAGLLEIADGEFQRIQIDSNKLKEVIHANLLDDLTQQGFGTNRPKHGKEQAGAAGAHRVRDLIAHGRYQDAVEWYNQAIEAEPNSHTILIGRAKVLFLLGDSQRALKDLASAERLSPKDPVIARTKAFIESGDIEIVRSQGSSGGVSYDPRHIYAGFKAIESGNGVEAFEYFANLESNGYNKAFAIFNKSMACAVEGDIQGSRDFLALLKIIPTTPMSVNIATLNFVLLMLDDSPSENSLQDVRDAVAMVPNFSLFQSHLQHLLKGLRARKVKKADQIIEDLSFLGDIEAAA